MSTHSGDKHYDDETIRARAALAVIPADDYGIWVDMAFALKHGFGDAGFELWDEWSRTAGNYDERAARTTWRSVKESGGKTLASLFWLARQHGFDLKRTQYPDRMAGALAPTPEVLERRAQEAVRQQARHAAVAREAESIWQWARPVGPAHPYLERKRLDAAPTLRELEAIELRALLGYAPKSEEAVLSGRVLIAPVQIGGAISTLELIDENGLKSSLAGGVKKGGHWRADAILYTGPQMTGNAGDIATPVLLGEGMATMLTSFKATGWPAFAALSSGNLLAVAESLRERYPGVDLIVLGEIGRGEDEAQRAAEAVQARLVLPVFEANARIGDVVPTDFNDMAVLSDLARVGDRLGKMVRGRSIEVGSTFLVVSDGADRPTAESTEDTMSRVKETLVNEVEDGAGRRSSKRRSTKSAADIPETVPASSAQQSAAPEVATSVPAMAEPAAESAKSASPSMPAAEPSAQRWPSRPPVGEALFTLDDVPKEIKALANHQFGSLLRMGTPRENGGPYKGEVFNAERYLIQEVGPRSVVFHAKAQMEFVSDRLRWMDENHRLNGADLQIGYDGSRPKVYPWDRERDRLERVVASLKKSARELNFSPSVEVMLDQLQVHSWNRIRDARTAARAQTQERTASEPPGPDR